MDLPSHGFRYLARPKIRTYYGVHSGLHTIFALYDLDLKIVWSSLGLCSSIDSDHSLTDVVGSIVLERVSFFVVARGRVDGLTRLCNKRSVKFLYSPLTESVKMEIHFKPIIHTRDMFGTT